MPAVQTFICKIVRELTLPWRPSQWRCAAAAAGKLTAKGARAAARLLLFMLAAIYILLSPPVAMPFYAQL